MKKILVVLLILAVAGGVFAQGSWSMNGNVELGATMDFFNTVTNAEGAENPSFYALDYKSKDDDGGVNRAKLGLNYGRDGFGASLTFKSWNGLNAGMSYYGDRYSLGANAKLYTLIGDTLAHEKADKLEGAIFDNDLEVFGTYTFLDGLVDLGVHVTHWISDPWLSDLSVKIFDLEAVGFDVQGDIYANFCCRSGIMAKFNFSGISFGAMIRSEQKWNPIKSYFWNKDENNADLPSWDLYDQVLNKLILGMKFDLQPIEVAAQFNLERFGGYVGLKWTFTDAISAGLSFMGELKKPGATEDSTGAVFGANLTYATDAFGATIKGGYWHDSEDAAADDAYTGIVAIAPNIWFNAIPAHLQVKLDTRFEFGTDGFGWEFIPGLTWNFKGTGAGDWATGIGLHYTLAKTRTSEEINVNNANITFCWNF